MSHQFFHFTLGPVQGFVAQARRTRDFWAGSFLLSWLAGVAMLAVERQGGKIIFPRPQEDYLKWLGGQGKKEPPRQGAIPNRFKAQVPLNFDANLVVETVKEAWWQLAEHVWRADLESVADEKQYQIWTRQHRNFWEISWVLLGEEMPDALDRRKNWRDHFHAPEPGVKCMVMDGWQELSGAERPNSQEQRDFWSRVRSQPHSNGLKTDFAEGERLCALAFVKRRFARHFASFKKEVKGVFLKGWTLPNAVPSVSYLAAVHWLEAVLLRPDHEKVFAVLEAARALDDGHDEWETRIRCLEEACKFHQVQHHLISRDGSLFFGGVREDASDQEKQELADRVHSYQKALRQLDIQEPLSPFYAILLMDGDSLGKQMSDPAKQQPIADALNAFTQSVPEVVEQHNGFLVYAGGDDVLAILPLEDALPCAAALRQAYLEACGAQGIISTLSGAIEFAHIKIALGRVLSDAHDLLDRVAKDGCGRDALAVRVWKPGGCEIEWAQPWNVALESGAGNSLRVTLGRLAAELNMLDGSTSNTEETIPYSSGFFYKIRERFDLLNPAPNAKESLLNDDESALLLATDYVASGVHGDANGGKARPTLDQACGLIEPLLRQCRPHTRKVNDTGEVLSCEPRHPPRLKADGALLVRFLAHKGVEPSGGRR